MRRLASNTHTVVIQERKCACSPLHKLLLIHLCWATRHNCRLVVLAGIPQGHRNDSNVWDTPNRYNTGALHWFRACRDPSASNALAGCDTFHVHDTVAYDRILLALHSHVYVHLDVCSRHIPIPFGLNEKPLGLWCDVDCMPETGLFSSAAKLSDDMHHVIAARVQHEHEGMHIRGHVHALELVSHDEFEMSNHVAAVLDSDRLHQFFKHQGESERLTLYICIYTVQVI